MICPDFTGFDTSTFASSRARDDGRAVVRRPIYDQRSAHGYLLPMNASSSSLPHRSADAIADAVNVNDPDVLAWLQGCWLNERRRSRTSRPARTQAKVRSLVVDHHIPLVICRHDRETVHALPLNALDPRWQTKSLVHGDQCGSIVSWTNRGKSHILFLAGPGFQRVDRTSVYQSGFFSSFRYAMTASSHTHRASRQSARRPLFGRINVHATAQPADVLRIEQRSDRRRCTDFAVEYQVEHDPARLLSCP